MKFVLVVIAAILCATAATDDAPVVKHLKKCKVADSDAPKDGDDAGNSSPLTPSEDSVDSEAPTEAATEAATTTTTAAPETTTKAAETTTEAATTGCLGMDGKKVYIIAGNGQRLARCNQCGPGSYPDSAAVQGKAGEPSAMWTLEPVGDDKCALKADNGYYASRCEKCWDSEIYHHSLFVHVPKPTGAYAQWTIEKHGNSFAFKSDIGKYVGSCTGCVADLPTSDFAFMHDDSPTDATLWKIEEV